MTVEGSRDNERSAEALTRLRKAARQAETSWPSTSWRLRRDGVEDPTPLRLHQSVFQGLVLHPGEELLLTCDLQVPPAIDGVSLAGEPLELWTHAVYPLDIRWEGSWAFGDGPGEVAPGPVQVTVVRELRPGTTGRLELMVRVPQQQTTPWVRLYFSTPGLRHRHEALEVAWAQLALADAVAESVADHEIVERAAATVPAALDGLDGPGLEAALAPLEKALEPLAHRVADLRVHIAGHSHIDLNWLWTWEDASRVILRDLPTVVRLLDEYPELTFTHSQAATYGLIRRRDPETFAAIRRHVEGGRWEVASMQWVESDLNLPSGEAQVRQLLEGVGFSRELLETRATTFLAPDTFGHAGNVPQLVRSAGGGRYYHHRCNPGGADYWPAYWWEGDDGTELLVLSNETYNGLISAGRIAEAALHAHRHGLRSSLLFHGIGDHGGGPTRFGLETLRRLGQRRGLPHAFCSTLQRYADEIESSGVALPRHRGELNAVFEGCYTTQGEVKRRNRLGESTLITADTLSALAGTGDGTTSQEAWRLVLFNQFHDILCGSSIDEAYRDNEEQLEEAVRAGEQVIDQAVEVLASATPGEGDVVVVNPLGWQRTEPVVIGMGTEERRVLATVPAFRATRLSSAPASGEPASQVTEDEVFARVVTEAFEARVHRASGAIVSLVDRRAHRQLVTTGDLIPAWDESVARPDLALGVFQLLDEAYHLGSAWHLDQIYAETSLASGATTEVTERSPDRVVLETRHRFRRSTIVQHTILYSAFPWIDYRTEIDWHEPAGRETGFTDLKIAFAAAVDGPEAWYETPFAATRRPADGREVCALRWADLGNAAHGIAVLNDAKHGYDALGSRLRLTLVHGSSEPDAVADQGRHRVRYRLFPHLGTWREAGVARRAAEFNQPLVVRHASAPTAAAVERPVITAIESDQAVLVTALKPRADGDAGIVARVQETWGQGGTVRLGLADNTVASELTVVEDWMRLLPVEDGRLRLTLAPWQVRTVRLSRTTAE